MSDELDGATLDREDATNGLAPVVFAAIAAGGIVTAVSVPLLGIGVGTALFNGIVASAVAATAALVGQRHVMPE